jgi:hypothetical protein
LFFAVFSIYGCYRYYKLNSPDVFIALQLFQIPFFLIDGVKYMFNPGLFLGPGLELDNNGTYFSFEFHLPEFSLLIDLEGNNPISFLA